MMKTLLLVCGALLISGQAFAGDCEATITSNDMMQYDKSELDIPESCTEFTLNLAHSGQLDKRVMGHNWVLSKADDAQAIARDGLAAGLEGDYLKADDERVIAATKLIGGGESTSVTFKVATLTKDDSYLFFCSFPGHIGIMKGFVKLV